MIELKTLRDIERLYEGRLTIGMFSEDLRQQAIGYIKQYQHQLEEARKNLVNRTERIIEQRAMGLNGVLADDYSIALQRELIENNAIVSFIKFFFNVTNEELK